MDSGGGFDELFGVALAAFGAWGGEGEACGGVIAVRAALLVDGLGDAVVAALGGGAAASFFLAGREEGEGGEDEEGRDEDGGRPEVVGPAAADDLGFAAGDGFDDPATEGVDGGVIGVVDGTERAGIVGAEPCEGDGLLRRWRG